MSRSEQAKPITDAEKPPKGPKPTREEVEAFAEGLEKYRRKIESYLKSFLANSHLHDHYEDLAQDTLVKAVRLFKQGDYDESRSTINTFLRTIARTLAISALRIKMPSRLHYVEDEIMDFNPSEALGIDVSLINKQRLHKLRSLFNEAVKKMKAQEYSALELRMLEYPYRDIAEIMGIPEGSVKSLIYRAKQKIKQHIEAQGIDTRDLWTAE